MWKVEVDWCKGCLICIDKCPRQALVEARALNKRGVHPPELKDPELCNMCRLCELLCPDFAITVVVEEEEEGKEPKSRLIIGGITHEV